MSAAHILVVDDEADIRSLLKEILSEEGYEVEVAANAVQARAARARQSPDLVLLDIWMPDVDGITLLREWSAANADGSCSSCAPISYRSRRIPPRCCSWVSPAQGARPAHAICTRRARTARGHL
jgi:CheY-like chemotaxis protein